MNVYKYFINSLQQQERMILQLSGFNRTLTTEKLHFFFQIKCTFFGRKENTISCVKVNKIPLSAVNQDKFKFI